MSFARISSRRSLESTRAVTTPLTPAISCFHRWTSSAGTATTVSVKREFSAGVNVSIPLTFAQGRGTARAARLRLRHDQENLELLKEQIALNVTEAADQVETTRKSVAAAKVAFDLAQQTADDELKKLRAGASNTFFVLQEQEMLAQAETSYYQALAEQRNAVAAYDREIGTTLARYHITLADK